MTDIKEIISRITIAALLMVGCNPLMANDHPEDATNPTPSPLFQDLTLPSFTFDDGPIHSIDLGLGYTLIGQHATRSLTDAQSLLTGSFDFTGEITTQQFGTVGFLTEGGQNIAHKQAEDLSANIGSGLGINDDLLDAAIAVTELWWTYTFEDANLTITAGKIDQTVHFDANRVANDETAQFLASPLVNSPAIAFPDNGPGLVVRYDHVDPDLVDGLLFVQGGLGNSVATASHISLNNFSKNNLFTAAEAGWENDTDEPTTTARVIFWHSNAEDTASSGFSVSCDHDLTDNITAFARFSDADADIVDFQRFVSAGCSIADPFACRPDDHAAAAFAWADPSDPAAREETLIETYYAFAIDENITLTADAQYVLNPAAAPDDADTAIFGFRLQINTN